MHFQIKKKNIEGISRYEYPQSTIHHSIKFAAIGLFYRWSTNNWIFVLYRVVILVQFWGKILMFNTHEIIFLILPKNAGFNTSIIYFQNATYTHCEVPNLAPSISAAIGSFVPQKYVWQACISLHSAPRFLFLYLYNKSFQERLVVSTLHFCNLISTRKLIQVWPDLSQYIHHYFLYKYPQLDNPKYKNLISRAPYNNNPNSFQYIYMGI